MNRAHHKPRHVPRQSHGPRPSVPLGVWQKRALYTIGTLVWLSGVAWLWLKYLARPIVTELGPEPHPAQAVWLRVHGGAAMLALIVLGSLLFSHVPAGWRQRRSRITGVSLLAFSGLLAVTGWMLYYVGDDRLRAWTSITHAILGVPLPLILIAHLFRRRRERRRRRAQHQ